MCIRKGQLSRTDLFRKTWLDEFLFQIRFLTLTATKSLT